MSDFKLVITYRWPVSEKLVTCGICKAVIQQSDTSDHTAWHQLVLYTKDALPELRAINSRECSP
jgi:hypothetical protein